MNKYLVLGVSFYLLYYLIFKCNYDKKLRQVIFFIAIGGMFTSIGSIFEAFFPVQRKNIRVLFAVPVFIALLIIFCLLIPMGWRLRKDPEKKIMIYTAFVFLIVTIIFSIIMVTLIQLGIFED